MISATFPADCNFLSKISEFVTEYAGKLPFNPKQIYEIDLAVDEAASNIIDHAYKGMPPGEMRLSLRHTELALTIILQDDGIKFDPSLVPEPVLTGPLEERRERGLGVFLIHKLMDEVFYIPGTPNGNVLTLIKMFESPMSQTGVRNNASLPLETLRIISEINHSISSTLDLDKLLRQVTDSVHEEFGYPFVQVFLVDYVPQEIVFKAGSGTKAELYETNQVSYPIQAVPGLIPLTVRSGTVQLSNDVSTHPMYRPDPHSEARVGSELCIPLQFQGEVLGVLDIQSDKTNAFTSLDREQLEILSQSISIALRNASLFRTSRWQRNLVERYRETAEQVSQNADPKELICYVIEHIPTILPVDFIGFWLKKDGNEQLGLTDFWCRNPEVCQPDPNQVVGQETWFAQIAELENGILKPAEIVSDPIQDCLELPTNYSAVAAPINYHQHHYGVLTFHVATSGRYGQDSVNICSTFADYIGTALDKQRVEAEKDRQAWLTSILLDLAIETKNLTTLDELTNKIGQILIELIGGVAVGLVLETENPGIITLPSLYCPQIQCPMTSLPLTFDRDTLIGSHDHDGRLSVTQASNFPELLKLLPPLVNDGTVLTFPLQTQDQTIGYLLHLSNDSYKQAEPEQVLDTDHFSILQGISQQAALSLQNIQMLEDKKEQSRISLRLLELGNILTQGETFEASVDAACWRVATESNLEGLALLAYQPDEDTFELHNLLIESKDGQRVRGITGKRFTKNEIEALIEPETDEGRYALGDDLLSKLADLDKQADNQRQFKTLMFALEVADEFYGHLLVCDEENKLTPDRIDYFARASRQFALAFQNFRLRSIDQLRRQTEQELNLARRIQKTFLPEKLPEIPGYQLSVDWETARQVGGDFYDIIPLPDNRIGMLVADVSDKGLPASLYMTVARTLLRAVSREFQSPARALERVNHLLQLDSTQSFFVTLVYAILDPQSGELVYTIAGHNPPYIIDSNTKTIRLLPKGGIAVGIIEPITLRDEVLTLEPGQSIILYTDGVSESVNAEGKEFGQELLSKILTESSGLHPEGMVREILKSLEEYQDDSAFEDDRTILILKRM